MIRKGIPVLAVLLIWLGCSKKPVFEEFADLPKTWNNSNIIHFNVNVTDTSDPHNVYISVRNTGKYEYSNLYLFVTAVSPNGASQRDTVDIILADQHGKWLGHGAASVFTLYYPYRRNIRFPVRGIYSFDIEQAMWVRDLRNINNIGIRIERAGKKV